MVEDNKQLGYGLAEISMKRIICLTEEQEQDILDKIVQESLIVNSSQVNDIKRYLNSRFRQNVNDDDIGTDGLPMKTLYITYYNEQGQPKMNLKKNELLDVLNDKFRRFVKDDASRLAYFNKIIDDWLAGSIKSTGQLSVNSISDIDVEKFRNYKKKNEKQKDKKKNGGD